MPRGAGNIRGEQLKTMAGLVHSMRTAPEYRSLLGQLISLEDGTVLEYSLSETQQAALREWRRDDQRQAALPQSFVEEFAQTTSEAVLIWQQAKEQNRFDVFLPFLEKIVELNQRKSAYFAWGQHPYDALLDEYEPGLTTRRVDQLFHQVRCGIEPILRDASQRSVDDRCLQGDWDYEQVISFGNEMLKEIGYDFECGRVDFSAHPFSLSFHPTDSRITSRAQSRDLVDHIFILLHEAGHALYDMGLPVEAYGTPLGEARSLGMHESQSRWWERWIGMDLAFWSHFFPKLQARFPQLRDASVEQFHRALHRVAPSLIRVDADEITYPLHVILRYEMERDLIAGTLSPRDVPEHWNQKMHSLLGVVPQTDREGCLQDIHWAMGAFGYFPTYTLGNLYAAHLFDGFQTALPSWRHGVAQGDFQHVLGWLRENVHRHGRRFSSEELLLRATRVPFSADAYLRQMQEKYSVL